MPIMQRNPRGGVIDTRYLGRGAGVVKPQMPMQAFEGGGTVIGPMKIESPMFENGGFVDDEDIESQGYDDAMVDPMAMVSGALNYGRKKYGLPSEDGEQEMGFEDGGVVPTEEDTAQGNPNAIDPRQAMAYLAGDGAVSPEIAQALEQRVDPQGQMNPTQRATTAIAVAPDDESRFGLLQHYRTKYNGYAGAAKAALQRGDMGEAAQQATMAMDSVPNGERTQFAPTANGFAKISRPAFGGGGQRQASRQQAFEDGGEVYDEDEETTQDYASAGMHGMGGAGEGGPQYRTQDDPDEDQEYARAGMGNMPPPAEPDNLNPEIPVQEPVTDPQATMPRQSEPEPVQAAPQPAAPQVVPAQELARILDDGFDNKLIRPKSAAERMAPAAWQQGVTQAYQPPAPSPTGAGGFTEEEIAARPRSVVGQAGQWLDKQIRGALQPSTYAPLDVPPAETMGSEAAARPTEGPPIGAPAAAPVTAPVTRPRAAPGPQPTAGAVIDDERWNPITRQMRPAAPGTFGTRAAAGRAGTDVPMDEAAAGASAQGVVPTGGRPRAGDQPAADAGPGFPTYKTYEPRQQQGVVPTSGAPTPRPGGRVPGAQEAALQNFYRMQREGGPNNFRDPTGTINVQTRPGSTAKDFEARGGRPMNEEEQRIARAQREAAAAHPWVGRDEGARNKAIEANLKRADDYDKEMAKQEIIERRAGARDQANLEKADVLERGRTDRANQLAQDNLARDRQRQASQERMNIVRSKLNAATQSERDQLRHLNERMRLDPSLVHNHGKLLNSADPIFKRLKIRPDELAAAAEIASTYDPESGTYDPKYGTGYGGPGGARAGSGASEGGRYPEGIEVGSPAPYNHNGKKVIYKLGSDGKTMWREDKWR